MHGGNLGRGLIPRNLRDSPTVDKAFRLKLLHHFTLELLSDSFTGPKTDTIEKSFWPTHTDSYKNSSMRSCRSPARSYGTRTLRGTRSRLHLRRRALRGFSRHAGRRPRVATVASDGRFMGQLFDWEGLLGHKRPTGMMSIHGALAFHCQYGAEGGALALSGPLLGGRA